jgi:hypothetical protein
MNRIVANQDRNDEAQINDWNNDWNHWVAYPSDLKVYWTNRIFPQILTELTEDSDQTAELTELMHRSRSKSVRVKEDTPAQTRVNKVHRTIKGTTPGQGKSTRMLQR